MQINVLEFFEQTVARHGDKVAILDRGRAVTFSDLRQSAHILAAALVATTRASNRPIAVFLPKSEEAVRSFVAILYSGNFYVPMDVKAPTARVGAILENLGPELVITNSASIVALEKSGWPLEKTIVLEEVSPTTHDEEALRAWQTAIIDTDPVYIIYTSGSTGVPKGVVIPHRGVIDYIDWARACYRIGGREIVGSQAPFFFDNSTLDLYLCLSCGTTLHLIPEELFAFPLKLVEHIRDAGITTIFWVPSVLTNIANFKILDKVAIPSLKKILFAGEVMPVRTLNYWRGKYPAALFSNLYGPTEITVDCTYYIVEREFDESESLPIGFACRNTDILILTDEGTRATPGERGELCVRGSSLGMGYWNAPEKTAAAFTQNPLNPHYPERIYRTGDLVYENERKEIIFIGRKDFQIKHQGYRIELGEIELAAGGIDSIRNACVLYNQTKQEITLFFESEPDLSPAVIREKMSAYVPKYMLPTAFFRLDKIPVNANGKTDRQALSLLLKN